MFRQSPTPVSDGAFRRLAQKVDLELLARVAKSDCLGRGRAASTARRWTGSSSARASSVSSTRRRSRSCSGRHLLALGRDAGPARGRDAAGRSTRSSSTERSRRSTRASRSHASSQSSARCSGCTIDVLLLFSACASLPGCLGDRGGPGSRRAAGRPRSTSRSDAFVVDARVALPEVHRMTPSVAATSRRARRTNLPGRGLGPGRRRALSTRCARASSRSASAARCCCEPRAASTMRPGRRRTAADGPTVARAILGALAAGVAELRRTGRLELPQRRASGWARFTTEREDAPVADAESRARSTINYGGGARWFTQEAPRAVARSAVLRDASAEEPPPTRPAYRRA